MSCHTLALLCPSIPALSHQSAASSHQSSALSHHTGQKRGRAAERGRGSASPSPKRSKKELEKLVKKTDQLVSNAIEIAREVRQQAGLPTTTRVITASAEEARDAPRHRRDSQGHYHCTRCAFSHSEWHRVMVHYQGHLAQGERSGRYQCKTCHKKLTSASSLSRHEKAHWERKWPCSNCLAGFSTQRDLNTHMQQVHKDQLGDFDCCYCGKTLRSVKPRSLAQHERYCRANPDYQGPFKCRQGCGKEFTRSCEEVRHQKICKGPQ